MTRLSPASLKYVPILLLASLLSACGSMDVKDSLGLTHRAPDEFRVYSRPPLSVPPEFNLTPPGEGTAAAANAAAAQAHREVLNGDTTLETSGGAPGAATPGSVFTANAPADPGKAAAAPSVFSAPLPSSADSQFLNRAGAAQTDPHVRSELQNEADTGASATSSTYLFNPSSKTDPTVDASKEATRIKQDKAAGVSPTQGDTPVIVPKDKGILGDIF